MEFNIGTFKTFGEVLAIGLLIGVERYKNRLPGEKKTSRCTDVHNLCTSRRCLSIAPLELYADDARCAHRSTVRGILPTLRGGKRGDYHGDWSASDVLARIYDA